MRTISKRLRRLEERIGPPLETGQTQHLRARLEAARRRCGLPAIFPERLAELRDMSIVDILMAGRASGSRWCEQKRVRNIDEASAASQKGMDITMR
jgi:hypothetical protein